MERECKNCYWMEYILNDLDGQCHRYPPIYVGSEEASKAGYEDVDTIFPTVHISDWCGEFKGEE